MRYRSYHARDRSQARMVADAARGRPVPTSMPSRGDARFFRQRGRVPDAARGPRGGSAHPREGLVSVGQLTFDKDYIAARKKRSRKVKTGGAGTGAIEGAKALGSGLAGGIGGVFYQPFKGAKEGSP